MKKRFTQEQTVAAVKRLKAGAAAKDLPRELWVTQQTLYYWKKRYGGMDLSEARRFKELELETQGSIGSSPTRLSISRCFKDVNSKKW
ncbi:MAG: hypothetical protein EOP06_14055 [Proteobacteria bacterium]|nr:MAG: hypothetical protein EOP06_14055 [Pseudomonadota bacterium]